MRSLIFGLCGSLPLMFGATAFTVNNADLVLVSGPGPVEVTNGELVYSNPSENGSPWEGLYSRNAGQQSIVLEAEVGGNYQLKIWSIPADPMNPQRQQSTSTVMIDIDGLGPFDADDLLELLGTWGTCPAQGACTYDLNNDGTIDVTDLQLMIANWNYGV